MFVGTYSGSELRTHLATEIAGTENALANGLATFDPVRTPNAWHRVLQGAEELFNLAIEPFDDPALHDRLVTMPLMVATTTGRGWIEREIRALYDGGVETRVMEALTLALALAMTCRIHGYPLRLDTVGDAANYFQMRRRRMVAFWYIMPKLCRGTVVATTTDELFAIIALMEMAAGPLTSLAQMAMMSHVFDDYSVTADGVGALATRSADLLDEGFLDPERLSVLDMVNFGVMGAVGDVDTDSRRLLSKAEVRSHICHIEAAFHEFGLAQTSFREVCDLIEPLLRGPEDYVVSVHAEPFRAALEAPGDLSPRDPSRFANSRGS